MRNNFRWVLTYEKIHSALGGTIFDGVLGEIEWQFFDSMSVAGNEGWCEMFQSFYSTKRKKK